MTAHQRDRKRPSGTADTSAHDHNRDRAGAGRTTRDLPPRPEASLPTSAPPDLQAAIAVQLQANARTTRRAEADLYGWGQLMASADPQRDEEVTTTAARGVAGPPTTLPHHAAIQASFGHHDISGVGAHVGGTAAESATAIGAKAYATGDQVAFRSPPDLFLAAHEAAHVVQQRGEVQLSGGVGQAGDRYEQHADAVASLVLQGASAESLLDTHAGSGDDSGGAWVGAAALQLDREAPANTNDSSSSSAISGSLTETGAAIGDDVGQRTGEATAHTSATDAGSAAGEAAARAEWDAYPDIQRRFKDGFATYMALRPHYVAKGIQNPAQYLTDRTTTVTFFGDSTTVHVDLAGPIATAAAALTARGVTPVINDFTGLNPRFIRGTERLSNHATGRAVDINSSKNPMVNNAAIRRVILAATGFDLDATLSDDDLRTASDRFKNTFTEAWMTTRRERLAELEAHPDPGTGEEQRSLEQLVDSFDGSTGRKLRRYAEDGFLNLEQSLIDELKAAGFAWGGEWEAERDFMHFEIPGV